MNEWMSEWNDMKKMNEWLNEKRMNEWMNETKEWKKWMIEWLKKWEGKKDGGSERHGGWGGNQEEVWEKGVEKEIIISEEDRKYLRKAGVHPG